jgi:hypothetical protein
MDVLKQFSARCGAGFIFADVEKEKLVASLKKE